MSEEDEQSEKAQWEQILDRWEAGPEMAFPIHVRAGDGWVYSRGMHLRDYFAAAAVQGLVRDCPSMGYSGVAEIAYKIADAMLEVREQ